MNTNLKYEESLASIDAVDTSNISPMLPPLRHEPRKAIAAHVRNLLKSVGVKHVSVTTPNYSMAQSIKISLLHDSHEHTPDIDCSNCPRCVRRWTKVVKIGCIILAAHPELNDRSDSQTDHFDYRLSIS